MVKEKLHHGEVRENTTVPVPLHHGAVKTPPWWSGNATMVKFLQHRGEIFTFTMVKFRLSLQRNERQAVRQWSIKPFSRSQYAEKTSRLPPKKVVIHLVLRVSPLF